MEYEKIRERANEILLEAMEKINTELQEEKAPLPMEAAAVLARLADAISSPRS